MNPKLKNLVIMPAVCVGLCITTHLAVKAAMARWPRAGAKVARLAAGKAPCKPCEDRAKAAASSAAKSGLDPLDVGAGSVVQAAR